MAFPYFCRIYTSEMCNNIIAGKTIFLRKEVKFMWDKLALILLIIGGINWGLVGIFQFDLVAWLFGGAGSLISRAIYIIIAICAVWCISLLFRREAVADTGTSV